MTALGEKQERTWAMWCHLTAFSGYLIPFGHVLGPLVIWLTKRNESKFVDEQGKEALNFQISMTIYALVASLLILVVVGFLVLFALAVIALVMVIMAAVKTYKGERFRYPITIRLIK